MKKIVLIVTVAALGLATIANAQYNKPAGISLRGGMFFPSNASAKAEGKTWFGVGIDYKLKDIDFRRSANGYDTSYSLSVDYYGKGDHANLPVLLNFVSRKDQFYYSAGAGLGFAKTPDVGGGTSTNTEFSYAFAIGFEFQRGTTPFFIEGRYMGSAETRLNGVGVYAGVRF
ncbi:MAG TPA: hypothetical protein VNI20_02265 [Fimbriimonadaceae bacterium]|nr:hypothetical protein [Fimbriimonadaceae bacterium]